MTACAADKTLGALIGLAVGDAIGAPAEFLLQGSFPPVTGMSGGSHFGLQAGMFTDDTSMALCMAESLVISGGFCARGILDTIDRWEPWPSLSKRSLLRHRPRHRGRAARISQATSDGFPNAAGLGNGAMMRLAPVVMAGGPGGFPRTAVALAGESARLTHNTPAAIGSARLLAMLLVRGAELRRLPCLRPSPSRWRGEGEWEAAPCTRGCAEYSRWRGHAGRRTCRTPAMHPRRLRRRRPLGDRRPDIVEAGMLAVASLGDHQTPRAPSTASSRGRITEPPQSRVGGVASVWFTHRRPGRRPRRAAPRPRHPSPASPCCHPAWSAGRRLWMRPPPRCESPAPPLDVDEGNWYRRARGPCGWQLGRSVIQCSIARSVAREPVLPFHAWSAGRRLVDRPPPHLCLRPTAGRGHPSRRAHYAATGAPLERDCAD